MQRRLHLAPIRCVSPPRLLIIATMDLAYSTIASFDHFAAGDEIRVTQPDLASRRQAIEFLRRVLHEIFTLNENLAAKLDVASTYGRIIRVIGRFHLFNLAFGIVID